ncbi:hypothetical protein GCM10027428_15900 [Haliea atlantica]
MSPAAMPVLGALEVTVLELVWAQPGISAKQVHETVGRERGVTLNTVQSTLDRLYRKALLEREKVSHAFRYRARVQRETLVAGMISALLGRFTDDNPSTVAAFVEATEQLDEDVVLALESELRARREQKQQ